MARKKIGKCICGGTIFEYDQVGFLGRTVKCDRCGSGETFGGNQSEKEIKKITKLISKGRY